MQQLLHPYLTGGVAVVVGAGLIAVVPAAPRAADPAAGPMRQQPIALAADPITPYIDLVTNTLNNLAGLAAEAPGIPLLVQLVTDPIGSLLHLPNAIDMLTTLLPDIVTFSTGLPIEVGGELTPMIGGLLAWIGPLVTTFEALSQIFAAVVNISDPIGAISALIGSPAILLDALLNGTTKFDLFDIDIPLLNGILVPTQLLDAVKTIGQLVEIAGVGDLTIGGIADQAGIADQSLAALAIQMLGSAGIHNPSIAELAGQFGIADQSVAGALIDLLDSAGIGNPTITELADQAGVGQESIAAVLNQVLTAAGVDPHTTTFVDLADQAGIGQQSLADLAISLLDSQGMGDLSVSGLIQQLGIGDMTLGDAAKAAVDAVAGGDVTVSGLLDAMGVGAQNLGDLVISGLGEQGQQTLLDIWNLNAPDPGIDLGDLLIGIMQQNDADFTLAELVGQSGMGDQTIGELLQQAPVPADTHYTQVYPPGSVIANMLWTDLLASDMAGNYGLQDLETLGGIPDLACPGVPAVLPGLSCSSTLNDMMGSNTVYQTLHNLVSGGGASSGVPANTPFTDITLTQLVNGTGQGDEHLSTIVAGLNMDTPIVEILTTLGLNDVTLDDIITNGFPWLFDLSVGQLVGTWGLDNLDVYTVIDRLGLTMTITQMVNDLGLDQVQVSTVLNDLLGGVYVDNLLNGLGLGDVTLETFLNNLLGGVYVGDLLNDLNLDSVHLDDVLNGLLGNVYIGDILDNLGMDQIYLNPVLTDLLGGVTFGQILDDLGISDGTVTDILTSVGLEDADILGVQVGDFSGLLSHLFVDVPQQIATALAGG